MRNLRRGNDANREKHERGGSRRSEGSPGKLNLEITLQEVLDTL